jgi:predicted small lipoprotein YifL
VRPIILLTAAVVLASLLAACGHRGPLYIPGKPGDPAYDREHRGEAPKPPSSPPGTSPRDDKSNGVNDSRS